MCLQYHMSLSSPSYPVLITGSYDRTLRVWNLDTGLEVRVLRGHTRAVRALQFDQMLLFTGAMDGTIRMWNWRAGDCLRVLEGHTDGVVALNYNGYLLASGSADSTIQVWNFRTGNKFSLLGHDDWVNSVVLWDGKTSPSDIDPTQVPSFTRHRNSLSPTLECNDTAWGSEIDTGAMLFSASDDGTIKLWDLVQQSCVRTFDGHKAQVQSLRVIMVDMSEAEIAAAHLQVSDQGSPPRVAFGLTPPNTLSPSSPGSTDKTGPHPKQRKWAADGDPSPNGCHALGSSEERKTVVHSADEHHKSSSGNAGDKSTQRKPLIASGSLDGTVKIWDVDTGNEQSTLFGYVSYQSYL